MSDFYVSARFADERLDSDRILLKQRGEYVPYVKERTCTMKQDGMFLVCSECGVVLMGNPRYCSRCGAKVLSEEEQGHMVADAIRRLEKAVEE